MAQRKRRSKRKEAEWRVLISRQRRSGLSIRQFCAEKGLSEPSFYAWRRELERRDGEPVEGDREQRPPRLIPVSVIRDDLAFESHSTDTPSTCSPQGGGGLLIEVVTPCGFTLRFDPRVDAGQVGALLNVISHHGLNGDKEDGSC